MAMEEFSHLLSASTQDLILASLYNATVGDSYRVGGVDGDNLYPSYSNTVCFAGFRSFDSNANAKLQAIMHGLLTGWTGRRLNVSNMTMAGEKWAQQIIDLFDRNNTLSEFNSATYTGISLYGLTLWSKYLPSDSVMAQNGPRMIKYTWEAVAQLWHPGLKNLAGPWDRSYGYDMNRYLGALALWLWTLIGKEGSSMISQVRENCLLPIDCFENVC